MGEGEGRMSEKGWEGVLKVIRSMHTAVWMTSVARPFPR